MQVRREVSFFPGKPEIWLNPQENGGIKNPEEVQELILSQAAEVEELVASGNLTPGSKPQAIQYRDELLDLAVSMEL